MSHDGWLRLHSRVKEERHALCRRHVDLGGRVWEHKQHLYRGFTAKYGVVRLVWYREFYEIGDAIVFEKQLKKWKRAWKIALIEEMNPDWKELYGGLGW